MSPVVHKIYIYSLAAIVVATTLFLAVKGSSYYSLPIEARFDHPEHSWFKPSGPFGHGLGIVGTLLILIGVFGYMAKKKFKSLARLGRLKYWLEFHIFLCTLGPVMILFHTAFKFGGLVSVSFWSMVAVVASGVAGRFIYLQIPRSIEGRALSLHEIQQMKGNLDELLAHQAQMDASNRSLILQTVAAGNVDGKAVSFYQQYLHERQTIRQIRQVLRQNQIDRRLATQILSMVKHEVAINHRIARLQTMQRLFKYWHVAHLPFALVMLVIMIIHVAVTLLLGYRWIF